MGETFYKEKKFIDKMKYSKDMGFAVIERNKPIEKGLARIFSTSFFISKKYFPASPKKFLIFVCESEEEYKKYAKPYYSKESTAVGLEMKGITTRSPDFVGKIGHWKKADFQNLMNHEISHIFWYQLCRTWSPQWFVEGLACHIGKNFSLSRRELKEIVGEYGVDSAILDFRYLRRNFTKGSYPRYPVWQAFTDFLMEEHPIDDFRKFIREFSSQPTKKNYKILFKKIFEESDKNLFNKFLANLKI
jgi:hypothetical protein